MLVGVFLGEFTATIGGGFTLQEEITSALLRASGRHRFILFGDPHSIARMSDGDCPYEVVSTKRPFLETAWSATARQAARLGRALHIPQEMLPDRHSNWLKTQIKKHGIHLMWFPTPAFIQVDVPYIYTVFDLQHRLQPSFPEVGSLAEWLGREKSYENAIRRASLVITGTEAGRREITQFYQVPIDRVRLVPHPTPTDALRDLELSPREVAAKYALPDRFLLYPAQFWPHKNHVGLLNALAVLRDQHSRTLSLVLVGSDQGNLAHVRRTVAELGLKEQVIVLGFVPRNELLALYGSATALAYVSFFGPENLPPLEALAIGCPVVAADVAGAREQLGDAALLVDPRRETEIATAILQLLDNPGLRTRLVAKGKQRAAQWTGREFVDAVLSAIDDLEPIRRCWP